MRTLLSIAALAGAGIAGAQTVQVLLLPTNDIVYDWQTGSIYGSVPSSAGVQYGNDLVTINPNTVAITGSSFIGSEPTVLALSGDGTKLYAGFSGTNTVRPYDTFSATPGSAFGLGAASFFGPEFAGDIQVMPGQDNTIAVSKVFQGVSPASAGVTVFDSGVARANSTSQNYPTVDSITWANPSLLYGYNNETTGYDLYAMPVDATGVKIGQDTANLISGFGVHVQYANGLVYSSMGRAVDPTQNLVAGTFQANGPFALDLANQSIIYLVGSGSQRTVEVFNLNTYVMINHYNVNGINGNVEGFVRFGANGLAFDTTGGQVFFISGGPVPEPAGWLMLGAGLCALAGRRKALVPLSPSGSSRIK